MLDRALPDFAAEVRALTPEVVVVKSLATGESEFHGASSFHLWGSILVNTEAHPTRLKLAEVLAHESGHALLHGATLGRRSCPIRPTNSTPRRCATIRAPWKGSRTPPTFWRACISPWPRCSRSGELTPDEEQAAAAKP